ncbi:hypothetical protein OEZ85_014243 [Tetradesmus obliquus]|uniref:Uncharacterized protein n=1 Tax=Tetradesmus obliquus TaxID=3088 RepID=A0ABY8U7T2_TETOB|nr:hypothetical protein OEZ85_014243 [Tetradesmus obliquus]
MSMAQLDQYLSFVVQISQPPPPPPPMMQLLQKSSSASLVASSSAFSREEAQTLESLRKLSAAVKQAVNASAAAGSAQLQPETLADITSSMRSMQQLILAGIPMTNDPAAAQQFWGHLLRLLPALEPEDHGLLFTPQQLAVLLWGFARKPPSAAAAEVMRQQVAAAEQAVQAADATGAGGAGVGMLSTKEQSVIAWAAARLRKAGLVDA